MTQIAKLEQELESRYKVKIKAFLELYNMDTSTRDMAQTLESTTWLIRVYASTLNLRLPKKFRKSDYSLYLSRSGESSTSKLHEELTNSNESLQYLSKQVIIKDSQLLKAKMEIAKYKSALKINSGIEDFTSIVKEACNNLNNVTLVSEKPIIRLSDYSKHKKFVLLSDLHFEETVSKSDTGNNEYNWDIAEERLGIVFREAEASYRGEEDIVVMFGGDMLDGLIHSSLETANRPIGKAIADLAVLLSQHLLTLSDTYSSVYVPCVSGNHERITDFKRSHNQGYGFAYMLYQMVKALLKGKSNVTVDISTTGFISFGNNGLFHGDFIRAIGDVKFLRAKEAFRQATGSTPLNIFCGHTHCFSMEEMTDSGKYVTNGSLVGSNSYSITNGMLSKSWGQTIGTWLPNGIIENVRLVSGL